MPELLVLIVAIIIGFAGLVWSADRFVDASVAIAKAAGLSPLIIGLTIVAFGTSAPEVLVSINAALTDAGELAIGNALGSNLANIGMVLGITALVARLPIQAQQLKHEWPILLGVTALAGVILADAKMAAWEGWLLLALIIPAVGYLIFAEKKAASPAGLIAEEQVAPMSPRQAALWFILGLAVLVVSSRVLVWGATELATFFGVSSLVIGLTVVAVGTSLPELAASVASALKGRHDIALGNVIGSNMFNLMAVMAIPALFTPQVLSPEVFSRDFVATAGLTLLLFVLCCFSLFFNRGRKKPGLGKVAGAILLTFYAVYYYFLF